MFASQKVEYVKVELPDTMMAAVQIIERLLTQALYHEKHVLYKAYPQSNIVQNKSLDDEDDEEGKQKGIGFGRKKKKNEAEDENKIEEEEVKEG